MVEKISNKEEYTRYFYKLGDTYKIKAVIYTILILLEILYIGFLNGLGDGLMIKLVAVITTAILVVQATAYYFRLHDINKMIGSGFSLRGEEIVVDTVKAREINGKYCTIYMDSINKNILKSRKYRIEYLDKTYGKYIVGMELVGGGH